MQLNYSLISKRTLVLLSFVIFFISCNLEQDKQEVDYTKLSMPKLEKLIAKDSLNPVLYFEKARKYFNNKQLDKAISTLNTAVKLDENNINYLLLLSDWHLLKGGSEKARQALDEALKVEPNNTDALFKMGVLYSLIDMPLKSFEYLNDALKIDPNLEQVYFYKSLNYCAVKDTTRAIAELQKAIEKKPDYADAYLQLGIISEEIGDTLAKQYYQNAIRVDSFNSLAHYDLGFYYQTHEQPEKAIEEYRFIIDKIDSTFSSAIHNIGYIYLVYSDELDTAIYYFDQAIALSEDYYQAYANKAYALELKKQYKEAKEYYRESLKHNPKHGPAINGLNRLSQK